MWVDFFSQVLASLYFEGALFGIIAGLIFLWIQKKNLPPEYDSEVRRQLLNVNDWRFKFARPARKLTIFGIGLAIGLVALMFWDAEMKSWNYAAKNFSSEIIFFINRNSTVFNQVFPVLFGAAMGVVVGVVWIIVDNSYIRLRNRRLKSVLDKYTQRFADRIEVSLAKSQTVFCTVEEINNISSEFVGLPQLSSEYTFLATYCQEICRLYAKSPIIERKIFDFLDESISLDELLNTLKWSSNTIHEFDHFSVTYIRDVLRKYIEGSAHVGKLNTDSNEFSPNLRTFNVSKVEPMIKRISEFYSAVSLIKTENLAIEAHLDAFEKKLGDAKVNELIGHSQPRLIAVYKKLHDAFDRHGLVAPNRLAAIPKEVDRINRIEATIDLYNVKIQRAEQDPSLNEEARARKIQSLQHLMEKEIESMSSIQ